jgi:hypothetical protein
MREVVDDAQRAALQRTQSVTTGVVIATCEPA